MQLKWLEWAKQIQSISQGLSGRLIFNMRGISSLLVGLTIKKQFNTY